MTRDLYNIFRVNLRFGSTLNAIYSSVRTIRTGRRSDLCTTMWYVAGAFTILVGFVSILIVAVWYLKRRDGRNQHTSRSKTTGPCNILPAKGALEISKEMLTKGTCDDGSNPSVIGVGALTAYATLDRLATSDSNEGSDFSKFVTEGLREDVTVTVAMDRAIEDVIDKHSQYYTRPMYINQLPGEVNLYSDAMKIKKACGPESSSNLDLVCNPDGNLDANMNNTLDDIADSEQSLIQDSVPDPELNSEPESVENTSPVPPNPRPQSNTSLDHHTGADTSRDHPGTDTEPTTGTSTTVDYRTGTSTTADHSTGTSTIGDHSTGTSTTGDRSTGTSTIGDRSTGTSTIGDHSTGTSTTADRSTGTSTTGDHTTGTSTSADRNTVTSTTANHSTGTSTSADHVHSTGTSTTADHVHSTGTSTIGDHSTGTYSMQSAPVRGAVSIKPEGHPNPTGGGGIMRTEYLDRMRRSILFIDTNNPNYGKGTGCIVELKLQGHTLKLLMTCNHVLPSEDVARSSYIYFDREDSNSPGNEIEGEELFNFEYFKTSPKSELDFTVVAMKPEKIPIECDAFRLCHYERLGEAHQLKRNDQVSLWHYPYDDHCYHRQMSSHSVKFLNGYLIGHLAQTKEGSSGCPVLKEVNNRLVVVGLHRGSTEHSMKMTNLNLATHVHAIHYTLLGKEHTLGAPNWEDITNETAESGDTDQQQILDSEQDGLLRDQQDVPTQPPKPLTVGGHLGRQPTPRVFKNDKPIHLGLTDGQEEGERDETNSSTLSREPPSTDPGGNEVRGQDASLDPNSGTSPTSNTVPTGIVSNVTSPSQRHHSHSSPLPNASLGRGCDEREVISPSNDVMKEPRVTRSVQHTSVHVVGHEAKEGRSKEYTNPNILTIMSLMPYLSELASLGLQLSGWLDMGNAWAAIAKTPGTPQDHVQKLLTQWLSDEEDPDIPHTWTHFIKVVRDCKRGKLAERMEREVLGKVKPQVSQSAPPNVQGPSQVLPDSILDSRPTELDINKLVGSRMSAEWDKLAMYLKFDSNTRQAIDRDNNGKCGRCFSNVVSSWLESKEGTGDLPRTWRSVLQAVRDCGHRGLADDVRVSLSGH